MAKKKIVKKKLSGGARKGAGAHKKPWKTRTISRRVREEIFTVCSKRFDEVIKEESKNLESNEKSIQAEI